ncbi:hypothetical protein ISF16_26460 [Pseudomonas aeruginosa]|nr:hypothetical protein [Pseudomonas aeruginosa]
MLGSAFWLTLATLLGLCLGFAREWLLVASWGAGERSDAFLIALFLPEALRMSLAGGVLSAAALPLFLERQGERRLDWLAAILPALLGIAVALSLLLLAVLPLIFGLPGIPLAALGGVLCTALLLMRRQALLGALPWARLWLLNALAMALAAGLLFRIDGIWLQLGLGTVAGCLALLGMALWLRPWRTD